MYEANEVSLTRRIVVLAITGVAIVAIVWFSVWFIFFRNHHTSETPARNRSSQSQTEKQSSDANSSSSSPSNSNGSTGTNNSAAGQTGTASSTATTTPGLANTGPGNVVAPVVIAVVAGSGLYYVRVLRTTRD